MEFLGRNLDALGQVVTGRTTSLFAPALSTMSPLITETYRGSRVLVTGGAGFIGAATLRLLLAHRPAKVVVADIWENGLAELVRDLRAEGSVPDGTILEPRLVDVTGPLIDRVVRDDGPFDVVLAFAAAKHVRTERDAISALQMLNVNINGTYRVLKAAAESNPDCRLFMVSTDKAADPSSLMGASKRVMEELVMSELPSVTTTRFANVAFSTGSLLENWLIRLGRHHALPVPANTQRYFVRQAEAGQICLLASIAEPGSIIVPSDNAIDSVELTLALERMLDFLEIPRREVQLSEAAGHSDDRTARVLITARDTAGEKSAEVFVGSSEQRVAWLPGLDFVRSTLPRRDCRDLARWIEHATRAEPGPGIDEILSRVEEAVPEFVHVTSGLRLDDRI